MRVEDVINLDLCTDETIIVIRDENCDCLACGNWFEDRVLKYLTSEIDSFTWQSDNKLYIDLC